MHRNKLACSLLVLAVAGGMWACSDDDTGSVGTAGSGGANAGSGGRATGGSGGAKAGAGGKAQGGEDTGSAGEGGASEVAGAGGDSAGGAGGAGGEPSEAGAGGEGGAAPALTLAEACTAVCNATSPLACANNTTCVDECTGVFAATLYPDDYATMIACQASKLTAGDYVCADQGGLDVAFPKAATSCETAICKWTCADQTYGDINAFDRCGCT